MLFNIYTDVLNVTDLSTQSQMISAVQCTVVHIWSFYI